MAKRKKPLRTKSEKQRQLETKSRGDRRSYIFEARRCQLCLSAPPADVHEIARGPARSKAILCRSTWLAVCRECHDQLGDYELWPIARQLAVKLLADAEHFDLIEFNRIRGRSPRAVELADVAEHLELRED